MIAAELEEMKATDERLWEAIGEMKADMREIFALIKERGQPEAQPE